MATIKIIRLVTGEELISTIENDGDTVILKKAAILIPAGEGRLAFAPWLPYTKADSGVTLNKKHVMFVLDPHAELENQYQGAINGLVVPSNDISGPRGAGLKLTL